MTLIDFDLMLSCHWCCP